MPGKLLVGQSGGATAVINASLAGIVEEAQRSEPFDAIWGVRRGAEGLLAEDFVDLTRFPEAELQGLAATPGAALTSSRYKLDAKDIDRALEILKRHDVRSFLLIGGNDSADTVHRLGGAAVEKGQELCAIAVPKTIDNDLPVTDHCPGYGSIARYVAIATMDSAKDTESMPTMYPVKFIEVMGRDAGWVAAAAALGKRDPQDPPHLIYVPEAPVSRQQVVADVQRVHRQSGYVVAVVAETLRDETGQPFADPGVSGEFDSFGHPLLRGTADTMCRLVQTELGLRSRFDKPGSLQRMSMRCVSSTDLAEARETGRAAVRLAMEGITDRMVTLIRDGNQPYRWHTSSAPLSMIANQQRLLPTEFLMPAGRGVTDAFREYALPLLGPEGLPRYARIDAPAAVKG
ncbi:MAG: 6-phosphofructokinase [Chloroflexota bacterium]